MFSADNSPIQELLMDDSEQMQQPTNNDSEDQEPPGYYDKAVNDDTDTEDGSSESSQELNFSEKTDLESDFEGYVKNTKRDNGVYLDRKAVAGERNSIQVYYEGNSVSGTEIILNGDSIGETGRFGSLLFTVPDADRLVVRTTTENLGTVEETYEVY
jgi:hypothetical protein